jgi:hypothetical protein
MRLTISSRGETWDDLLVDPNPSQVWRYCRLLTQIDRNAREAESGKWRLAAAEERIHVDRTIRLGYTRVVIEPSLVDAAA